MDARDSTGYLPIEKYGLIGNMRTCALVGTDGGLDYMCWPEFDSPSVFCRILDKDKGGHFTIRPISNGHHITTKQRYLPCSNVLQTRWTHEDGAVDLTDFFPRSRTLHTTKIRNWLVRRLECRRGEADLQLELHPAFNYARDQHTTKISNSRDQPGEFAHGNMSGTEDRHTVVFQSASLGLQLDVIINYDSSSHDGQDCKKICSDFQLRADKSALGDGVTATIHMMEGVGMSFILRESSDIKREHPTKSLILDLQEDTLVYWSKWLRQCNYRGRFREDIERSLLILKLLTYEPTGAIIAAPTFSLPEDFGGSRNWDYRYSWIRDSSFTIYVFLRMGFTEEAEAYVRYVTHRMQHSRTKEGAMPIMFGIREDSDLEEIELPHLDGYRGSKPVRIGNGAAPHLQLDIYGELMDGFYLYNKYGKPISYDQWVAIRDMTDYICGIWQEKDMSIWEVRGDKQNFVYSKIMLWVAFDRAIRLAEKRCLPCPNRNHWLAIRDQIYEDIMEKGFNKQLNSFIQSYEHQNVLDAAVLIAPLVFFIAPNDPRFLGTLDQILKAPERGGLTSTDLVYRYNTTDSNDGVGGREGSFSMCTFWLVEALTRAGKYEKGHLLRATAIFENMLAFGNHLGMFSEEIARSGEQLGNTPQAFSHLALISAAFNLDRTE